MIPEVAGKVTALHSDFVAGGFFERNAVLVTIDARDYDAAIVQAQAQIAEVKRQLAMEVAQADQAHNEWQALGEGVPSALTLRAPQLAEARAKLKAAQANLLQARVRRSRCELRAPFTGRLLSKNIGLGQFIQPGDKLARIFSTDVAEIRLPLTTAQLGFLDLPLGARNASAHKGPKVSLTAQFAGKLQTWEGYIVRTEGALDESTGVLYAVAEARGADQQNTQRPPLLPNLFVQAEIAGKAMSNVFVFAATGDECSARSHAGRR